MLEIPQYTDEELIETLQGYQKEIVNNLLKNNTVDKCIEIWINTDGILNNANFGGEPKKNKLLENFKIEFCKLLCEYPEYEDQIKEIKIYANLGKETLISGLTFALAPKLGTTAIILTPLVVLALIAISKVGIKAYCNTVLKNDVKEE